MNFESFSILKFRSFQFFFLSFCWSLIFLCAKFHKGGEGVSFLLVNFEGFLFWYFKVLESSICFLSFWGLQFFCMEFHKRGEGAFAFLLVNRVFCYVILKFRSLQFNSCHFVGFHFFCAKFHKGREGVFTFLLVNFESFVFWYFEVLEL